MRGFKTTKQTHIAAYLLEYTESEQRMQIPRALKEGYVKENVLFAYFGGEELKKTYPKKDIEAVLDVLVKAGLLEEKNFENKNKN